MAFRQAVCPLHYEQRMDERDMKGWYGLENGAALVQPWGQVDTFAGQSIAFPNLYQQCRSPLILLDHTRPGHRSFIAFFLVDPTQRVLSTARVPPQKAGWVEERLAEAMEDSVPVKALLARIVQHAGWPMQREEARKHRRRMERERVAFTAEHTQAVFEKRLRMQEDEMW